MNTRVYDDSDRQKDCEGQQVLRCAKNDVIQESSRRKSINQPTWRMRTAFAGNRIPLHGIVVHNCQVLAEKWLCSRKVSIFWNAISHSKCGLFFIPGTVSPPFTSPTDQLGTSKSTLFSLYLARYFSSYPIIMQEWQMPRSEAKALFPARSSLSLRHRNNSHRRRSVRPPEIRFSFLLRSYACYRKHAYVVLSFFNKQ